jgi:hypothetical protein
MFHIVCFEERTSDNAAFGWIRTFQFTVAEGWVLTSYSRTLPIDGLQKFGVLTTQAKVRKDARKVIRDLLKDNGVNPIPFPQIQDLPKSLQCMRILDLNILLQEIASNHNTRIVGKLPDEVIIIRNEKN